MSALALPLPTSPAPLRGEILRRYEALGGQTHAQVLGVPSGADPDGLRQAYQRLARRFHPDTLHADVRDLVPLSQAIFIRATEAYKALAGNRPIPPRRRSDPRAAAPGPAPVEPCPRGRAAAPPRSAAAVAAVAAARPETLRAVPPRPILVVGAPGREGATVTSEAPRRQSVDEALHEARERLDRDDVHGAVGVLHGVLARSGDDDGRRIRLLLARGYMRVPHWRRYALGQLRSLIEERPQDAEALALLGALYRSEGFLARAETMLARSLFADPGRRSVRATLAEVRAAREATRDQTKAPLPRERFLSRFLRPKSRGDSHARE